MTPYLRESFYQGRFRGRSKLLSVWGKAYEDSCRWNNLKKNIAPTFGRVKMKVAALELLSEAQIYLIFKERSKKEVKLWKS